MAMITDRLQRVLTYTVPVYGYKCLFAYDESSMATRGYWLCRYCGCFFYTISSELHFCHPCTAELAGKKELKEARFIQVIGPNWQASQFECKDEAGFLNFETQRIKKAVCTYFESQKIYSKAPPMTLFEKATRILGYERLFSYDDSYEGEEGYWSCRYCQKKHLSAEQPFTCFDQSCSSHVVGQHDVLPFHFVYVIGPKWHAKQLENFSKELKVNAEKYWAEETDRIKKIVKEETLQLEKERARIGLSQSKESNEKEHVVLNMKRKKLRMKNEYIKH